MLLVLFKTLITYLIFHICFLPSVSWKSPQRRVFYLSCLLPCPQYLQHCLAHGRYSIFVKMNKFLSTFLFPKDSNFYSPSYTTIPLIIFPLIALQYNCPRKFIHSFSICILSIHQWIIIHSIIISGLHSSQSIWKYHSFPYFNLFIKRTLKNVIMDFSGGPVQFGHLSCLTLQTYGLR